MKPEALITAAFKDTWQAKRLWWLAILVIMLNGSLFSFLITPIGMVAMLAFIQELFSQITQPEATSAFTWTPALTTVLVILFAVPTLITTLGVVISPPLRGMLILATRQQVQADPFTIRDSWATVKPYILRLIGLNILIMLPTLILLPLSYLPYLPMLGAFTTGEAAPSAEQLLQYTELAQPLVVLVSMLSIPVSLGLMVITTVGIRLVLFENATLLNAAIQSFKVVWRNLGDFVITYLLYMAVGFGISLVSILPMGLIMLGFTPLVIQREVTLVSLGAILTIGTVGTILAALLLAYIFSFTECVWTRWYLKITDAAQPAA